MYNVLYPYFFVGILLSVVWLFYRIYKDKNTILPNISFWGASIAYAFIIFLTDFSFYYKLLLMVPRDVVAFVVVFLLANNMKSSRGFFFLAMGVGVAGYFLYSNLIPNQVEKMWNTYQQPSEIVQTKTPQLNDDGELLIDIKPGPQSLEEIKELLAKYDAKIRPAFPNLQHAEYSNLEEYYLVDLSETGEATEELLEKLLYETKQVDWVEENEIIKLEQPRISENSQRPPRKEYGINDPNLDQMWGFEKMEVDTYYEHLRKKKLKPKKKAKIAILDTGVDGEHEDIKDNYVSTRSKYDRDVQSHGTHCAGIAASVSNNGLGVASLSLDGSFVEVTSIKVLNDFGMGTQDDILRGIIEAADNGADVISMSLGGPARGMARRAYDEAFTYAQKSGAIVVVAAGNDNRNAKDYIPASCKGVITVTALGQDMGKAKFSNTIEGITMGIAAPGVDILSTIPKNKYAAYSGTSMATPYVAGLLGVMKALKPDLTQKQAYEILKNTGKATSNTSQTGKMIHPLKAIQALN